MGGASTSSLALKGVPMPPTAWALASVWSAVWEAPRFQRGRLPLRREEVAPLLKVAASCVAALLPHVAAEDRRAALPPYGASRELLVAALDGAPAAAALPSPSEDPQGFVRTLVRAAFTTGDGDLLQGLSSDRLDELLAEHCGEQLDLAGKLLTDPSAALRSALEAAAAKVGEVAAAPAAPGDLQGVAGRLLLLQRLERLGEEAGELLELAAERVRQEELEKKQAELERQQAELERQQAELQKTDEEPAPEAAEPAEEAPEPPEPDTEPAQPEAQTEVLERTRSQVAASLKVQKVKEHLDESKVDVHDLGRTVSHLTKRDLSEDESIAALEAELAAVEQARKRARNFGEDLVEDMLALDGLQNLRPEDRSTRKLSIAGIEALLQDVDAAKSRLGALHGSLQARLDEAKAKRAAQADAAKAAAATEAPPAPPAPQTARERRPAAGSTSAKGPQSARVPKQDRVAGMKVPKPTKDDWRRLRLPLRFHSREEADQYVILASVPGLDAEELKLELGEDSSTLSIQGLRVPSSQEAALMQKKISARLLALAQHSPQQFARVADCLDDVAAKAYAELGQDEYGRFSETFRVPRDVDVSGIDASYRDGVLRVLLPKAAPRHAGFGYDGMRGGRYASGRRGAPAGFPAYNGWGPGLFGGVDDGLYW